MILKLEGFTHASSLDLNILYYHILLPQGYKHICTIVLPWRKYKYQNISMGVSNSLGISQEKISNLYEGFYMVRVYINYVLVIYKDYFVDHLKAPKIVLHKLPEAVLKLNL